MILQQSKSAFADPVTSAAGAIPVLFDGTIFAANVPAIAFEIIRVTGGAIRRVLGIGPGNSSAYYIAVAAGAAWIPAVIARVVPLRAMAEAGWRPAIGGMTHVALFCRV